MWKVFRKKINTKKINFDGKIIRLKYRVKYQKKTTNDKILLKRNVITNKYEIYYWRTR
jgi:hypothetical protein